MNKKKSILAASILLTVLLTWALWPQGKSLKQVSTEPIDQKVTEKLTAPKNKQLNRQEAESPLTKSKLLQLIAENPKAKGMYEAGKLSNMDIEFYGRVIDQHGEPVVGAKVGVSLLKWRILDAGGEYHEFTTDSEGYFDISGISGEVMTIRRIEKDGYEIIGGHQKSQTFRVEGIRKKNKSNPYVFHAWKKTEAEPLFFDEARINFDPLGTIYAVDLRHWAKVANGATGDIRISCKRPLGIKSEREPFDWKVIINSIGGGIIESDDTFMNQAPENGYHSVWKLKMNKQAKSWRARSSKKFYLKSRNGGLYGRLELTFIPIYNENCRVNAKWWLNPNGSRNLQYDPKKRIYLK